MDVILQFMWFLASRLNGANVWQRYRAIIGDELFVRGNLNGEASERDGDRVANAKPGQDGGTTRLRRVHEAGVLVRGATGQAEYEQGGSQHQRETDETDLRELHQR